MSMSYSERNRSCFEIANTIIDLCKLDVPKVTSFQDFTSYFFIGLFERIFGMPVPDLIDPPDNLDDETHNIQSIIDTIATDILDVSLSHITAKDIMDKNMTTIYNLLEVLEGYFLLLVSDTDDADSVMSATKLEGKENKDPTESEDSDKMDSSLKCEICGYQQISGSGTKESKFKYKFGDVKACPMCSKKLKRTEGPSDELSKPSSTCQLLQDLSSEKSSQRDIAQPGPSNIVPPPKFSYFSSEFMPTTFVEDDDNSGETYVKMPYSSDLPYPEFIHLKEQTTQTSDISVLSSQSKKQRSHKAQDDVAALYGKNFESHLRAQMEGKNNHKQQAAQIKKKYLQSLKSPCRKSITPLCKKSFLLPYQLKVRQRFKHVSNTQVIKAREGDEMFFIKEMRKEFPGVNLPDEDIQRMNGQFMKHLASMHKCVRSTMYEKSQAQIQEEEAIRRQKILADIFKKERDHMRHTNAINERKQLERRIKASHRNARLESAKMKQYYDEFTNDMKKKLLKTKNQEELLVKKLFKEQLQLEKEQVQQLRKDQKEKQQQEGIQHKIYMESMQNYYESQQALLAETLANQQKEMEERTKAQKQAVEQAKREHRSKLKKEIKAMQEEINTSPDLHFRELDAERYREQMRDRYSSRLDV